MKVETLLNLVEASPARPYLDATSMWACTLSKSKSFKGAFPFSSMLALASLFYSQVFFIHSSSLSSRMLFGTTTLGSNFGSKISRGGGGALLLFVLDLLLLFLFSCEPSIIASSLGTRFLDPLDTFPLSS